MTNDRMNEVVRYCF